MAIEFDPESSDFSRDCEVFFDTETGEYMEGRLLDRDSAFYSYAVFSKEGVGIIGFEGQLYVSAFCEDDPELARKLQFIVLEVWDISRSVPFTNTKFSITDEDPLFEYVIKFLHGRRIWRSGGAKKSAEFEIIYAPDGKKSVGEIKRDV
jgi:hypothetical protein